MKELNKLLKRQNWRYQRRMNYIAKCLHWIPAMPKDWWLWALMKMEGR